MELVKIIKYLEKKFPLKLMSAWDKSGLQILDSKSKIDPCLAIENVLVCLDLTQAAFKKALDEDVNFIITRHPFIFEDLKIEKQNLSKKKLIQQLLERNILVYSIHTNYDASPNQQLPLLLESEFQIRSVKKIGVDHEGYKIKLKTPLNANDFSKKIGKIFEIQEWNQSLTWNGHDQVVEFCLVTGSGGQTMVDTQLTNTFLVTGEVKWNHWIYANENNVQMLVLGHYMENYFVNHLLQMLSNAFKELKVLPFDIKNQYF